MASANPSSESLIQALSGSVGSAIAMGMTYPLEQLRTLMQAGHLTDDDMQVDQKVLKKYTSTSGSLIGRLLYMSMEDSRGIGYLYQGCESVLETVAIANFLYFYSAQYCRTVLKTKFPNLTQNQLALVSSTMAAVSNVLMTEPLWKVTTILKLKRKQGAAPGLIEQLVQTSKEEGVYGMWKGTNISLLLVCNPIIQFTVYEYLKGLWLSRGSKGNLSAGQAFVLGAVSKAVATVFTYPLQIVQTRLRISVGSSPPTATALSGGQSSSTVTTRSSVFRILFEIYQKSGSGGLFQGMSAKMAQTVLTAAFMFAFYERIAQFLRYRIFLQKKV